MTNDKKENKDTTIPLAPEPIFRLFSFHRAIHKRRLLSSSMQLQSCLLHMIHGQVVGQFGSPHNFDLIIIIILTALIHISPCPLPFNTIHQPWHRGLA